jgi:membrane fusion protein, multidrug efflux system
MQITKVTFSVIAAAMLFSSCGSKKKTDSAITDKKVELQKLKDERTKTDDKIKSLEQELAVVDTSAENAQKAKLVSVSTVSSAPFTHYIELQGRVDAENTSYVSPKGMGGQVIALYVKKGDIVKKGQLLLKLDDAVARQNVVALKQSMGSVASQLALAKSVYERQQNLWNKNIGTEVQLLNAKTNVETLENQLKTMQQNVKTAQEQVNQSSVYSNVAGVADEVNIHVGETFTGNPAMGIKIVNTSNLKVTTDIPENYLSRVKKGSPVEIVIPDLNKTLQSTISLISQSISQTSRGFTAEAKVPNDPSLKPNLSAVMRIKDYQAANVIVIPVNTVQSDDKGKYVFVMQKLAGGKTIAKKKPVVLGEITGDKAEVKNGLAAGDQIITEGYQTLYDGQVVNTTSATL